MNMMRYCQCRTTPL
uniref:Uncharacterized protein n=1 Tax=Anguilla anguilla TaxID=7936 RepID=A0A0E9P9M9_ANGAN